MTEPPSIDALAQILQIRKILPTQGRERWRSQIASMNLGFIMRCELPRCLSTPHYRSVEIFSIYDTTLPDKTPSEAASLGMSSNSRKGGLSAPTELFCISLVLDSPVHELTQLVIG